MAQLIGVLVPLFLFVTANWCLTTLFEGEGSFKDIFIAVSYSLVPVPLLMIPAVFLSNFVITTEASLIALVFTIALFWMGILVFFGTMVTHDYSMGKNLITFVGTIVGMALIIFVALLFSTLVGKIISLITNIVVEIQYRV
ncbi:MAG: YIP1 family protein [Clostridia bacterium]|nr:YIP1 family protein [Clostridia bacterium]